jgi:Sigma 54 modulation/S30EA ribosomal protein C terminus
MAIDLRTAPPAGPAWALHVTTRGILPTNTVQVVCDRLLPILGASAVHSRVRLARLSEPGAVRPIVAQLDIQLARQRVRAQVAAATPSEVVSMLAARTIGQLHPFPGVLAPCLRDHGTTSPPPSPPELLPPLARRLVRHKMCEPLTMTAGEAIAVLEAMDYRFHLFRERYSRQDSVVVRTATGHYQILQPTPNPIGIDITSPPMALTTARRLTVADATARLDLTGGPFEIFVDRATGRTSALYARYDGHYGLLAGCPVRQRSASAGLRTGRRSR